VYAEVFPIYLYQKQAVYHTKSQKLVRHAGGNLREKQGKLREIVRLTLCIDIDHNGPSALVEILLGNGTTDMRKEFDGLSAIVEYKVTFTH